MTPFTKRSLTIVLNVAQWLIDNDPAPQTDTTLTDLREKLNDAGNTLASEVEANQPS